MTETKRSLSSSGMCVGSHSREAQEMATEA